MGAAQAATAPKLNITYPSPGSSSEQRGGHTVELLRLALTKAGVDFQLQESPIPMVQARAMKQLENNQGLDVVWTMTSAEREKSLLPIRIPLDKGMLGWRLLLIKASDAERFAKVRTLDQLKPLLATQGHDWPDTRILDAAGLRVTSRSDYDALFQLLERGDADYFPRSVQEIWADYARVQGRGIVVEQTLLLRYPTALYFFVNRHNQTLANLLEKGLRLAIKDGSFEALFLKYYGDSIRKAKLRGRTVIELKNPLLSPQTPLQEQTFWYRPAP